MQRSSQISKRDVWLQIDLRRSYIIALSKRGVEAMKAEGIQVEQKEDAAYLGSVSRRFRGKPRVSQADPGSVCFDRSFLFPVEKEFSLEKAGIRDMSSLRELRGEIGGLLEASFLSRRNCHSCDQCLLG